MHSILCSKPNYSLNKSFILIGLTLIATAISGQDIHPHFKINTSGAITDFIIDNPSIILSTDAGTIETYNIKTGKRSDFIQLPPIENFYGDIIPAKIHSIDKYAGKLLAITQSNSGFRNAIIFENGEEQKIINADIDKMMIKKSRWINNNNILLGLLSNDLIIFEVTQRQIDCELNICPSAFSDFSLTEDKQFVFTADESGIVHKIDLDRCEIKQDYSGINVDNIYQLVNKNGIVITAGKDRRVGVYNTITGNNFFLQKNFLVYSVALNSIGSIGACSADEENNISIFMIANKRQIYVLKGHESLITKMAFIDDQTLVSAGDDQYLIIWKF